MRDYPANLLEDGPENSYFRVKVKTFKQGPISPFEDFLSQSASPVVSEEDSEYRKEGEQGCGKKDEGEHCWAHVPTIFVIIIQLLN